MERVLERWMGGWVDDVGGGDWCAVYGIAYLLGSNASASVGGDWRFLCVFGSSSAGIKRCQFLHAC